MANNKPHDNHGISRYDQEAIARIPARKRVPSEFNDPLRKHSTIREDVVESNEITGSTTHDNK